MFRRFLASLLLIATGVAAAATNTASRIDAVTIYPNGAMVTRVAEVELPAGNSELQLSGLVGNLDADRIRVEADDSDVSLGELRVARQQQRDAYNEEIERLNADIRAAEGRIAAIDDSVKSAELRLTFLDSLAKGYAQEAWHGGAQGSADVASWRQALELLNSASGEAYTEIREQKSARAVAVSDLSLLQRELETLRGGGQASTTLDLSVRAPRAMTTSLRVHYFQERGGWRPLYEARLDSDAGRLALTQQAAVFQGTDEAWDNVELSLSTNDPGGELAPADIGSEFLDLYEPQAAKAARRDSAMYAAGQRMDSVEEVAVTDNRSVATQIGNFAVTYRIPGRVSVDNRRDEAQNFDVDTVAFDVSLVTRIVPRNGVEAYLAARFNYARNVPLYGSSLRVFVDGAYAGTADMPTILPQSEVTLPMGDDRRVEVNVVDRGRDRGREGIVSRRRTETYSYLFEIANRRETESLVEVLDRYPVARNRDIEVEVTRDATPPTTSDVDDRPGVVLWRKTVNANETWRIEHAYTVSYPADKQLSRR